MVMKSGVQWSPLRTVKISASGGTRTRVGQISKQEARNIISFFKSGRKPQIGILKKEIKGRRPSVPRRVKCQYVVNMSITCMLKMPSKG